ncbi:unnamed protein product [Rotaria magnacalcarata]
MKPLLIFITDHGGGFMEILLRRKEQKKTVFFYHDLHTNLVGEKKEEFIGEQHTFNKTIRCAILDPGASKLMQF